MRLIIYPLRYFSLMMLLLLSACKSTQTAPTNSDDGIISFSFLSVNDVYEIGALEGGQTGGMARLATLYKQLKNEHPNLLFVHAGDFLSPSLLGVMKYEGERIKGRQMVELMNLVGIDLASFGNHEFDLDLEDLQKRINESEFEWIGTNTALKDKDVLKPFFKEKNNTQINIKDRYIWKVSDADGTTASVGIFGAVITDNPVPYVHYHDPIKTAIKVKDELLQSNDVVIGLTHLGIDEDVELAEKLTRVPLLIGGHDHHHMLKTVGDVVIAKADANAKTAYLHILTHHKKTGQTQLESKLIHLGPNIQPDPLAKVAVDRWEKILDETITQIIPNPYEVIYHAAIPLEGRESVMRLQQTNLGELVANAMLNVTKAEADAAIINSGSFRIDDQISGDVSPIDVFRALPFGGGIVVVKMKGDFLSRILKEGSERVGSGAYLQRANISHDQTSGKWLLDRKPIDAAITYTIAMNDFLLKGYDLPFLKADSPELISIDRPSDDSSPAARRDIRVAVIDYLETLKSTEK